MREKRILEALGDVEEVFITEAYSSNEKSRTSVRSFARVACLCLIICDGIGMLFYHAADEKKYYNTSMEEISNLYEGMLLAENLSYEEACNTRIQICYTGDMLPFSEGEWEAVSVSADYEDYALTMDCRFSSEDVGVTEEEAIEKIEFGDTTVFLYEDKPQPEYDLSYYAVFEYEDVVYELHTYTNEEKRIYDILETVLGEVEAEESDAKQKFSNVLGYTDYYVKVEEVSPGFIIQKYFTKIDGAETCIAQVYGYVVPEPEVFSKDLDGDGIDELICNCMAGTGAARVCVYRNNDGVIEKGRLVYDSWDKELFSGITDQSSSAISEKYIPDKNVFEVTYYTEEGIDSVIFSGLDAIEFQEYKEE